jgi:hypothetical protein
MNNLKNSQHLENNNSIVWGGENFNEFGDAKIRLLGTPSIVETPIGGAVEFNGRSDAIFVDNNPLIGLRKFTVEVIFQPVSGGLKEQRFLHIGETHGDRLLFETRLTDDGKWYLDNYINSGKSDKTLLNKKFLHPLNKWYHLALVFDGENMNNFVNGYKELHGSLTFNPMTQGKTSIGVRQNKVCWFKGKIHKIRVTPKIIDQKDFILI